MYHGKDRLSSDDFVFMLQESGWTKDKASQNSTYWSKGECSVRVFHERWCPSPDAAMHNNYTNMMNIPQGMIISIEVMQVLRHCT